jgi:hypothetical protein
MVQTKTKMRSGSTEDQVLSEYTTKKTKVYTAKDANGCGLHVSRSGSRHGSSSAFETHTTGGTETLELGNL